MQKICKNLKPHFTWATQTIRLLATRVEATEKAFIKDERASRPKTWLPISKYGGENIVTLLTGTSTIGKQASSYIKSLVETAKVPICFENIDISPDDNKLSNEYILSVQRNRTAVHVDLQYGPKEKRKSTELNRKLDLFACVFNMKTHPGFNCRFPNVDLILTTQNNVGDNNKLEYEPVPGMVETLRIATAADIYRYIDFVFAYAQKKNRNRITVGHKENVFVKSDGMFLDITQTLWKEKYNCLKLDIITMDKLILGLVTNPEQYDVICTTDRFGTMTAAIAAAVCGGASLFSAIEMGDNIAIFKPLQTKLSVTDVRELSPYGVVKTCIDLLNYLDNKECAKLMSNELECSMFRGIRTEEFGGTDIGSFVICSIVNDLKCKFAG